MVINRFEVHLVHPDPTGGHEMERSRPCLLISPDEVNYHIRTAIVAPTLDPGVEEMIGDVLP